MAVTVELYEHRLRSLLDVRSRLRLDRDANEVARLFVDSDENPYIASKALSLQGNQICMKMLPNFACRLVMRRRLDGGLHLSFFTSRAGALETATIAKILPRKICRTKATPV